MPCSHNSALVYLLNSFTLYLFDFMIYALDMSYFDCLTNFRMVVAISIPIYKLVGHAREVAE